MPIHIYFNALNNERSSVRLGTAEACIQYVYMITCFVAGGHVCCRRPSLLPEATFAAGGNVCCRKATLTVIPI